MTKAQETALAAGALTIGAALLARGLRAGRAIDFRDRSVVITGARGRTSRSAASWRGWAASTC
jgi:hypothetical protein